MQGFKAYEFYIKMKIHFSNKDVDFSKKRPTASYKSFEKRSDAYIFAKMLNMNDFRSYILSNLIEDPQRYVRQFSDAPYIRMKKAVSSLTYLFQGKLKEFETERDLKKYFLVENHKCEMFNDYLNKKIDIEIICIFNIVYGLLDEWHKDDIFSLIYEKELTVIKKYSVFFEDSLKKYSDIIKNNYK